MVILAIILFAAKTTTKMTMSYYSTQIRDSLGREIRVSKEPAPILQNAGLIFSQYWLSKCHFFDDLFACFGDCLQTVRSPKSSRANVYSNKDLIKQRFYPASRQKITQSPETK